MKTRDSKHDNWINDAIEYFDDEARYACQDYMSEDCIGDDTQFEDIMLKNILMKLQILQTLNNLKNENRRSI